MTQTPKWLPDNSGIDPKSLEPDTVVETEYGDWVTAGEWRSIHSAIVRVYADVTPPKPDPRLEVVARALATESGSDAWQAWTDTARAALAALDAMGADQ